MSFRENAKIVRAEQIATGIFEMCFETEKIAEASRPGQFISVYSKDGSRLLPRPISICSVEGKKLTMVYRVAGKGTEEFSGLHAGDTLQIQGPLGNGYDVDSIEESRNAIIFGGGIGIPPMLELSKRLKCKKTAVLGYRDELFLNEEFEKLEPVFIATEDGSCGTKGNVLDAVKANNISGDIIFACGPTPMLRAIKEYAIANDIEAYVSLEEKMACGIGACLACVCKSVEVDDHSKVHNKRICKEGPVFNVKEVELG